jgi:hypothetical protein
MGLSVEKLTSLLKDFGVRSVQHQHKSGAGNQRQRGYFLRQLELLFCRYASDIWQVSEPARSVSSDIPETPEEEETFHDSPNTGVQPVHLCTSPGDQVSEPIPGGAQVFDEGGDAQVEIQTCAHLSASQSRGVHRLRGGAQVGPPKMGKDEKLIPPSTTKRGFCRAK